MNLFRKRCRTCGGDGSRYNRATQRRTNCINCAGRGYTVRQWPWVVLMAVIVILGVVMMERVNPYLTSAPHNSEQGR